MNYYFFHQHDPNILLQRNETRRVGGTNARLAMFHRLVGNGEFTQIVTNHLWFDFDGVERFAIVYTNHTSNHFRNNDHVPEMSLHDCRLFVGLAFFLGFAKLLEQGHWLPFQTTAGKPATSAGMDKTHELLIAQVQKVLEVNAPERELLEGSFLARGGHDADARAMWPKSSVTPRSSLAEVSK